MFDQPGVGLDDLAWIQRDQFIYYLEMEHHLADPADWPTFRLDLLAALTAALGLHAGYSLDRPRFGELTEVQRRALHVIDQARQHHDPATDWTAFREAIWARRHELRDDLAP